MHRVLAWIQSLATVEYTVLDNVRVVFLLSKCFLLVFFLAKIVIHVCYAQHINSVLHSWREKKKKHKKKTCRRQWAACQTSSMWNRHLYHHCKPLRPFSHSHVELILNVLSCRVGVMAWTFVIRLWRLLFLLVFNLGSTEANTNIRTRGERSDFTVFT